MVDPHNGTVQHEIPGREDMERTILFLIIALAVLAAATICIFLLHEEKAEP